MNLLETIGATPLITLPSFAAELPGVTLLAKAEFMNPSGSVKDRAAKAMVLDGIARGLLTPGKTIIDATSGNTGIALAMVAAIKGYKMILLMPDSLSMERRASMKAYGAELILVTKEQGGMEGARDLALQMERDGKGKVLNQFANQDNPAAHILGTGPEIWRDTQGGITHFVSAMGTTGTIMGTSTYLKTQNPAIQIVGVRPATQQDAIPGIRRWSAEYLPEIFDLKRVDLEMDVTQAEAEEMMRRLAVEEGIFCGVSSGGAMVAALRLSERLEQATVVTIICDRGDRYISTGVFPA